MTSAKTIARSWQRATAALVAAAAALLIATPARAVNIVINYQYDTLNFFGADNPSGATAGAQAKAALDAAASFYSTILTDNFSAIQKPADLVSTASNGVAFWNWTANFSHPATGALETLNNPIIAANEYRIYAGARSLSGSTLDARRSASAVLAAWAGRRATMAAPSVRVRSISSTKPPITSRRRLNGAMSRADLLVGGDRSRSTAT
ncbi:hypothetical protein [Lacipirellula parvula]|uniref:Uncharacterized protein n=1 Tax=Lacipirellula parvula TaxID=2650471 RepID=A0A5K7X772_9BACT|nr:hypothetical protein [Lacipirellula parvula]BBO32584.1 hypothetical protein PLANPX_2196 [Lacipirellula parvula]